MTEFETNPEERATAAAEALSAEGIAVTARAVRQRSEVSMKVATDVARAWTAQQAQATAVPAMSATVSARFEAVWREAVVCAREEFEQARVGWRRRVEQVEAERDAATEDLEETEAERDAGRADIAAMREQADHASAAAAISLTEQRSIADRATARAEALETELEALRSEIAAVRDQAGQAAAQASVALAEQRSLADRATARAEAVEAERDRLIGELARLRAETPANDLGPRSGSRARRS